MNYNTIRILASDSYVNVNRVSWGFVIDIENIPTQHVERLLEVVGKQLNCNLYIGTSKSNKYGMHYKQICDVANNVAKGELLITNNSSSLNIYVTNVDAQSLLDKAKLINEFLVNL